MILYRNTVQARNSPLTKTVFDWGGVCWGEVWIDDNAADLPNELQQFLDWLKTDSDRADTAPRLDTHEEV